MSGSNDGDDETARNKDFLRLLGSFLVSIVGNAQKVYADGTVYQEREFAVSGTIVSCDGKWLVLTAGHCVTKYLAAASDPGNRLTQGNLAFCFGKNPATQNPIAFSIPSRSKVVVDCRCQKLDYALFPLDPEEVACLKHNGIKAFPLRVTQADREVCFESFGLVGFPREVVEANENNDNKIVGASIRADYFPLSRMPDDSRDGREWFKGRILDRGKVKSIVGVSGGPIFGFYRQGDDVKCQLLGIQSWWDEENVCFGCTIENISVSFDVNNNGLPLKS